MFAMACFETCRWIVTAMNHIMRTAVEMAQTLFEDDESPEDVIVSGETNLMAIPDFFGIEKTTRNF